jgi:hypothetical protein
MALEKTFSRIDRSLATKSPVSVAKALFMDPIGATDNLRTPPGHAPDKARTADKNFVEMSQVRMVFWRYWDSCPN